MSLSFSAWIRAFKADALGVLAGCAAFAAGLRMFFKLLFMSAMFIKMSDVRFLPEFLGECLRPRFQLAEFVVQFCGLFIQALFSQFAGHQQPGKCGLRETVSRSAV